MNKILQSIEKNKIGIFIIMISAINTSIGQYFWKISEGKSIKFLSIGFLCYGLGAVAMIVAFKFGSFSVIHPMLSMGYIFALFIGYGLLNEEITKGKLIGIFLILIGVMLIGVGDE